MVISKSLKEKGNNKVKTFLAKYKVLLGKIDGRLPIIIKRDDVTMKDGGNWEKQFLLAIEIFAKDNTLSFWQEFVQIAIDNKFHGLVEKLKNCGVFCYSEIEVPKVTAAPKDRSDLMFRIATRLNIVSISSISGKRLRESPGVQKQFVDDIIEFAKMLEKKEIKLTIETADFIYDLNSKLYPRRVVFNTSNKNSNPLFAYLITTAGTGVVPNFIAAINYINYTLNNEDTVRPVQTPKSPDLKKSWISGTTKGLRDYPAPGIDNSTGHYTIFAKKSLGEIRKEYERLYNDAISAKSSRNQQGGGSAELPEQTVDEAIVRESGSENPQVFDPSRLPEWYKWGTTTIATTLSPEDIESLKGKGYDVGTDPGGIDGSDKKNEE